MASVTPYLTFNGNCEEAIEFYCEALDGDIVSLQRFGDVPDMAPADMADKIMHCVLAADDVIIMASDSTPSQPVSPGTNVHLSLDFDSLEELQDAFEALSEGGTVTMPLQDTFWGARFGMLVDRYGVSWMFNYDLEEDVEDEEEEASE